MNWFPSRSSLIRFRKLVLTACLYITISIYLPGSANPVADGRSLWSWKIPAVWQDCGDFNSGRAVVEDSEYSQHIIDQTGRIIYYPQEVLYLGGFSEGLIDASWAPGNGTELWGYLNKSGRWAISPKFSFASAFSEGLASVSDLDGKLGYITQSGSWAIKPGKFWSTDSFRDGLAEVSVIDLKTKNSTPRYGLINKHGDYIVPPKYLNPLNFSEGLGAVKIRGRWGFIDKSEKFVIRPKFTDVGYFDHGAAPIEINGKWGLIDKTGKYLVHPKYGALLNAQSGIYSMQDAQTLKWGAMTAKGILIKPQPDEPLRFDTFLTVFSSSSRHWDYGLMDAQGRIFVPAKYLSIGKFDPITGLVPVENHLEKCGYMQIKSKSKIPLN